MGWEIAVVGCNWVIIVLNFVIFALALGVDNTDIYKDLSIYT